MKLQRKVLIDCQEVQKVFSTPFVEVYVDTYDTYYFVSFDEIISIIKNVNKDQIEFFEYTKENKDE